NTLLSVPALRIARRSDRPQPSGNDALVRRGSDVHAIGLAERAPTKNGLPSRRLSRHLNKTREAAKNGQASDHSNEDTSPSRRDTSASNVPDFIPTVARTPCFLWSYRRTSRSKNSWIRRQPVGSSCNRPCRRTARNNTPCRRCA